MFKWIEINSDNISLALNLDVSNKKLVIQDAKFTGEVDERFLNILQEFCLLIRGRPLQEAADHGVIYAMENLSAITEKVQGIQMPRNSGQEFVLLEKLIRSLFTKAIKEFDADYSDNSWYVQPSSHFKQKNEQEQADILKSHLQNFINLNNLGHDDIWICEIERARRVTISFGDNVPYRDKPSLVMRFEKFLRDITGDPLEIFVEEMRDVNKGRRL